MMSQFAMLETHYGTMPRNKSAATLGGTMSKQFLRTMQDMDAEEAERIR